MSKSLVLAEPVVPYAQRKAAIESEALPSSLGALLDAATLESPDQVAIHFFQDESPISYEALRHKVNRLANGLAARGIRHGTHVAVMMPNVAEFPITWLALARIGAVMVPLNIAYTAREVRYVIDDSKATWLCIHDDCMGVWSSPEMVGSKVDSDRLINVGGNRSDGVAWADLSAGQPSDFEPESAILPDDLLNIQYTSGTTGFPKGCMLSHRYWLVTGKHNAFRDGRKFERIMASTPFFYMDPQWLLVMTMYQVGTLFVAKRQSASRFMEWMKTLRVNFTLMPDVILKQPPSANDTGHEIIRANVYGLSRDNHALFEQRFDLCAREAFGMTEIGSALFMPIENTEMIGSGSCGIPVPFREVRIIDESGHDVPDGVTGELVVRGLGMMQGYYNRPEVTKAAFLDGWFKTGDLFRRDQQGFYYIVGRIKDMIRRAGENIAAHEVESVLLSCPLVAEAAAVAVKDDVRGEEVKAYLVLQPSFDHDKLTEIIHHCAANLAPFKVPRYFEFREKLPKTASGKIAKPLLEGDRGDPRRSSYDRVAEAWL